MGWRYSSFRKAFQPPEQSGSAMNVIGEEHYGIDHQSKIIFPNVSTCTTLTLLLGNGRLIGGHLTMATPVETADAIFDAMNQKRIQWGQNVVRVYLVGALMRGSGWNSNPEYGSPIRMVRNLSTRLGAGTAPFWMWKQPYHETGPNTFYYRVLKASGPNAAWQYKGPVAYTGLDTIPGGAWAPITDNEFTVL